MSDIYLGRPGALITIPHPRGGIKTTPDRPSAVFRTGSGNARVGRALRAARQYILSYDRLYYSSFADLEQFQLGHAGPGPFIFIDQSRTNRLTVNQSGTTSLTNDSDGFSLNRVVDTFAREVPDTNWGNSDNGVATSAEGDGTAAMYFVQGRRGVIRNIVADSTNIIIYEQTLVDQDFTVFFEVPEVATGDVYDVFAAVRWTDIDNQYRVELDMDIDNLIQVELGELTAGVFSSLGNTTSLAYVAGSKIGVRIQAVGNRIRAKVWNAASGQPDDWQITAYDSTHTSGKQAVRVQRNAANTNTDLEVGFYDVTVAHPGEMSSESVTVNRGPRALSVDFDQAGAGPTVAVVESPSNIWPGVPVIPDQQMTFSGYIRASGSDVAMDVTAQMVWFTAARTLLSTSSGTPVTTNSSTWQQVSVTATAPSTAAFVSCRLSTANNGGSLAKAGLFLPGTSGHYASTPDNAALDIVGDIGIRVDATLNDWSSATVLLGKWTTAGNQRSYRLETFTDGLLYITWSTAGSAAISLASGLLITDFVDDGARLAVRADLDVNNGSGGHTARFYIADTMDSPWFAFGDPVIGVGVTSIFSSTAVLEAGSSSVGTTDLLNGTIHEAELYNSAGALVANPEFYTKNTGTTSFADTPGRTWTVNGAGSQIRGYSHLLVDSLQLEAASAASAWRPGTGIYPVEVTNLPETWPWQAQDYRENVVMILQEVA